MKVLGDFSNWEQHPVDLRKLKNGEWKATLPLAEGKHEYRYLVDGQWRDDPNCRYRIVRPHARGGLGRVSVAVDEELSREVALKEIHEERADDPDSRARFVTEAEINRVIPRLHRRQTPTSRPRRT